ncbi:hypothetical protein [Pedobacter kyonggii]|uniref:hypothetical protein n=1 Tax=Pedobacter kyonggii TaxID=1926871 RepID=UPI0013EF2543|nr:hypothetical protein [Pedobacter kyonggii]
MEIKCRGFSVSVAPLSVSSDETCETSKHTIKEQKNLLKSEPLRSGLGGAASYTIWGCMVQKKEIAAFIDLFHIRWSVRAQTMD